MSDLGIAPTVEQLEKVANREFSGISEGFVNSHNLPTMTTPVTPATPGALEVVVTGSTICLGC
ncbi:cypemycin family RiPP [Actinomyces wuliandei]|uniref:cypemycin family RiPP n=1 Tax=Actinomyces wuliandei TaxID=2057743 RepID=UPI00111BBEBC